MYLDSAKKTEIFGQYGKDAQDTGSVESQVALFTYRIQHLTEHLKKNHKDFGTARALTKMVGRTAIVHSSRLSACVSKKRSANNKASQHCEALLFSSHALLYRDVNILLGDVLGIGKGSILLSLDDDVLQVDALDRHLPAPLQTTS